MKSTTTIAIAALLAGGAGGYFAGKAGSNQSLADENQGDAIHDTRKSHGDGPGSSSSVASRDKKARSINDILAEPSQMGRMQALMDLYSGMDAKQLAAEADKLERLPMNERIMASFLLFGRWGEVDGPGAIEATRRMGMGGAFVRPTILQSWASVDPANAAKYFSENPREFAGRGGPGMMGGGNGASVIASEWAKLDSTAALAWANTLSGQDKGDALSSVVREMATKDPSKAAQVASTLTGDDQTRAYQQIASQWGTTDFSAAKAWINSLPAASQGEAMASALASYASTDPAKAAAEAASLTGDAKSQAIGDIAQVWARTDPAKAAEWVASQGGDDNNAMRGVMMNWVNQDSSAALSFIQKQPQGDVRDQAVGTYIFANRDGSGKDSVALAESITDERSRDRALAVSAQRWMQEDETAAKAYIESSTQLSDETKQNILEGRNPWGGGPGGGRGFGGGGGGGGRGGRGR